MNYSLDKYKFYEYNDPKGKKTVSAVSTYAGRTVKGYAKCDPRDNFNIEKINIHELSKKDNELGTSEVLPMSRTLI